MITLRKKTKDGIYIKAIISTERGYFSVTGETKYSCGCIHNEILETFPNLKPLVDLHLSNLDGKPMHCLENGFYWACKVIGIKRPYEPDQSIEDCKRIFKEHLRLFHCDALFKEMKDVYDTFDGDEANKVLAAKLVLQDFIEKLKPAWKKQADNALKLIETLNK